MVVLPIVERELRVASRQRGTYLTRFGAVLASIAVGGWIMLMPWLRSPQKLGLALFIALSVITFIYSIMVGVRTTADCISEEKREGTLGLLFLTDLKGFDIVLGKMAATSVSSFYGMLAIFPILAISILAGGVSGGEFWRVALAAINNVFFSLSVGIFCSAISRDERKAMAAAFGVLLLFCVLFPVTGALIADARRSKPDHIFFLPSPAFTCFVAFDETAKAVRTVWTHSYYLSFATVHVLSWIFLGLACWIVPRTWHDKVENSLSRSARVMRWIFAGSAQAQLKFRRAVLDLNPFFWLTSRDRSKTVLVWLLLVAGGTIWAWGLWKYPRAWNDEGTFVFSALVTHAVLKVWLATEATRQLGLDRRSGALELLLSTPITIRQIIQGQLLSLWKQFGPPSAVVILTDLIFLTADRDSSWKLFWITIIVVFILDMVTLAWVGMWLGLAHKHPSRAAAGAIARVLALPWAIFLAIVTAFAVITHFANSRTPNWIEEEGAIILGGVIAVVIDAICLAWARKRLLLNLRETAAHRFETRPLEESTPRRLPTALPQGA